MRYASRSDETTAAQTPKVTLDLEHAFSTCAVGWTSKIILDKSVVVQRPLVDVSSPTVAFNKKLQQLSSA